MTKKQVGVIAVVIAVVAVAGVFGFTFLNVGLLAGEAHKTVERMPAFKEGFEKGKSCKIGALGVPLGTRCKALSRYH